MIVGFAGSVADAFSLSERFEDMLNKFSGNLMRSAVELAQTWRSDKVLRKLEAMLIVADSEKILIISGNGDVIEPQDDVCAIGSGGNYALASAKALYVDIFTNNVYNEKDHLDFIVAFYIFRELNLINITDDDIIKFNEKKVELTQSTLYNYINR